MSFNILSAEWLRGIRQTEVVQAARQGDLRPLVALLRAAEPLSARVRDFIADELDKPSTKRFRRQIRTYAHTAKKDRFVIECLDAAKLAVSDESGGTILPMNVTDARAYIWLSENGIEGIDEVGVNNARRRFKAQSRSPIEYANGKGLVSEE